MFYLYLVLSAALIPILNNFFEILRQPYSWWLVPVLFIAFFLGFVILHLIVTCIWIATANVNKPPRGTKAFRVLANITIPLLLKLARVSVKTEGAEKIPEGARMLFVCNHQHDLDPVMLLSAFPSAELGFIGKKDIYKDMPFIAKAMHRLYCLPIDRENDREALKAILKAIQFLKEDKCSIVVFPEGGTNRTEEDLLPFRNGAFKVAQKAHVPIVICALVNSKAILKNMFRRHTDVYLDVLDVIPPEQFAEQRTVEVGDRAHRILLEGLRKRKAALAAQ